MESWLVRRPVYPPWPRSSARIAAAAVRRSFAAMTAARRRFARASMSAAIRTACSNFRSASCRIAPSRPTSRLETAPRGERLRAGGPAVLAGPPPRPPPPPTRPPGGPPPPPDPARRAGPRLRQGGLRGVPREAEVLHPLHPLPEGPDRLLVPAVPLVEGDRDRLRAEGGLPGPREGLARQEVPCDAEGLLRGPHVRGGEGEDREDPLGADDRLLRLAGLGVLQEPQPVPDCHPFAPPMECGLARRTSPGEVFPAEPAGAE